MKSFSTFCGLYAKQKRVKFPDFLENKKYHFPNAEKCKICKEFTKTLGYSEIV